jgi:imidazolonepropionase-like amidohydrolase
MCKERNGAVQGPKIETRHSVFFVVASLAAAVWFAPTSARAQTAAPAEQSAAPALPADIPTNARRTSVLTMGNLAGHQAVWTTPDGKLHAFFQFNDRGRGPKTTTVYSLDKDGLPVAISTVGNDYLKTEVREDFSAANGTAHWKNTSENGEKALSGKAYYVGMYSPPEDAALMVRAALASGGRLSVLPAGEVRARKVSELEVTSGAKTKRVSLYEVAGLNFSPDYLWLDDQQQFFAAGGGWSMIISEGWESAAGTLKTALEKVHAERSLELAKQLIHHPAGEIVFAHANVFDAGSATIVKDQDVVIGGNKIISVAAAGKSAHSKDAQVIDAAGKTLLPGLWDMHAHVGDDDGLLNLAAGVTTVRDLANDTEALLARIQRINQDQEVGTRIILAGIIDGKGPFQGPTSVLVDTEAEARAAVDNYKRLGYVQIKVYSSVKPELVPAIIDEAHRNGLRVSGHIPSQMTASECIKLGFDEVQHANFLMLNFMPDVKETRTPARFSEPAKRGADLDLNSPEVKGFVQLLLEHHTTLDPTLSVFEEMFEGRPGQMDPVFVAVADRLPVQLRRGLLGNGLPVPDGMDTRYRQSFAKMESLVGLLYKSGIPIEAGTDALAGFSFHRELELDVQSGIPAPSVLQLATLGAARIMKRDTELGSVTAGKIADVVLVDGHPEENISDVRKTVLVVKDGAMYKPAELYKQLGVQP